MKLRYKLFSLFGFILIIIGWLHFKHPIKQVIIPAIINTKAINNLPDYGHGVIYKVRGKQTSVTPKVTGFPFDIGTSLAIGSQSSQLYLTTEIFYYRHFEVLTGLGITYPVIHPRVFGGFGYRLPWKRLDNISLFSGLTTASELIVGIYWRFGSN